MRIVIGRGQGRKVYELPHGSLIQRAAREEPKACRELLSNVAKLLNVVEA